MELLPWFRRPKTLRPAAYSLVDIGRDTVKAVVVLVIPDNAEPQVIGYGLAETVTNKGSYVAFPITLEELKEIFELRFQVEPKIAAKALQNITSQQLTALEDLCSNMETIHKQKESFPDYFIWNREFHLKLYQPAGWRYLLRGRRGFPPTRRPSVSCDGPAPGHDV